MSEASPRVQRPALLWIVAATAFAAMFAAIAGLLNLDALRRAGPIPLTAHADEILDALSDSPWIGSESNGPIVWSIVKADRACCWRVTPAALAGLSEESMELRMIVVAPRGAAPDRALREAAGFAQERDWPALRAWVDGKGAGTLPADPDVTEGYAEWGRASFDRVAAILRDNGVEPRLPLVIWRVGPEWRVLTGSPNARLDAVRRDMAVAS